MAAIYSCIEGRLGRSSRRAADPVLLANIGQMQPRIDELEGRLPHAAPCQNLGRVSTKAIRPKRYEAQLKARLTLSQRKQGKSGRACPGTWGAAKVVAPLAAGGIAANRTRPCRPDVEHDPLVYLANLALGLSYPQAALALGQFRDEDIHAHSLPRSSQTQIWQHVYNTTQTLGQARTAVNRQKSLAFKIDGNSTDNLIALR